MAFLWKSEMIDPKDIIDKYMVLHNEMVVKIIYAKRQGYCWWWFKYEICTGSDRGKIEDNYRSMSIYDNVYDVLSIAVLNMDREDENGGCFYNDKPKDIIGNSSSVSIFKRATSVLSSVPIISALNSLSSDR